MSENITAAEMRALENAAIESGKVDGLTLMERAGQAVVDALVTRWPDLSGGGAAVLLCGPGNNGGDGFVVARLLRARGWRVTVFFYGKPDGLPPDARANHDRWLKLDGQKTEYLSFPLVRDNEVAAFAEAAYGEGAADVVVDALFGIGLTRPLDGLQPLLALAARQRSGTSAQGRVRVVSVDLPSGLAESGPLGESASAVLKADLTVTFHRRKVAHGQGEAFCGEVVVQDIGL